MNRIIAATVALLSLGAILYFATIKARTSWAVDALLPSPSGERAFEVNLQTAMVKRAADGTKQQLTAGAVNGTFYERWEQGQDGKLQAVFMFQPDHIQLFGKNVTEFDAYEQPVFLILTPEGAPSALTYPRGMPPGVLTILTKMAFFRNFSRGEGKSWKALEQGENGPVTVHYFLGDKGLTRTIGDPDAREGYHQSKIDYGFDTGGQVATMDIDVGYVKSVGEFKLMTWCGGSFRPDRKHPPVLSQAWDTLRKAQPGAYQTVAMDPGATFPVAPESLAMPRMDLQKAFGTLEEVLIRGDSREKTSYFMALSRYFAVVPDDLEMARDYILAIDPAAADGQEKVGIVIGAMDRLIAPQAEDVLITLLSVPPPSSLRDDIVLQSAMSLGGHLAPSSKAIQALWQAYNDNTLGEESRSAALMALGAVAGRLGAEGSSRVRRLLLPLVESGRPSEVILALAAIANHGESAYAKTVNDHLRGEASMPVRLAAAHALHRIRSQASTELLHERALGDPSAQVRLACAQSLAGQKPGKKEAKLALEVYEQSMDLAVRESALAAYSALSREEPEAARRVLSNIQEKETVPALKALAASYLRQAADY